METHLFEYLTEAGVVVYDFVGVCRMVHRAGSADLNDTLVCLIPEIDIRYSAAYVTSRLQVIITIPRSRNPLF
ncbi:hypothetical protein D3C81_1888210 [compost metagenome]